MKRYQMCIAAFLIVPFMILDSSAEPRIWQAQSGQTVEAEFVSLTADEIVLRKIDKTCIKVPLSMLSEIDQRFAIISSPPTLSASVKIEDEGKKHLNNGAIEYYKCFAKIDKTDSLPYPSKITATLYMIGRNMLIDQLSIQEQSSISLNELEKGSQTVELNTKQKLLFKKYNGPKVEPSAYKGFPPVELEGYILIITDALHHVIFEKESQSGLRAELESDIGSITPKQIPIETYEKSLKTKENGTWVNREPKNGSWGNDSPATQSENGVIILDHPAIMTAVTYSEILKNDFTLRCKINVIDGAPLAALYQANGEKQLLGVNIFQSGEHLIEITRENNEIGFKVDGSPVKPKRTADLSGSLLFTIAGGQRIKFEMLNIDIYE